MPTPPQARPAASPSEYCSVTGSRIRPPRLTWMLAAALALLAVLTTPTAQAQTHVFTGGNAESIQGEVISLNDGQVIVKRTDGKAFSLDLSSLSAADRAYLQTWKATANLPKDATATTDSDIEITVSLEPVPAVSNTAPPGTFIPKVNLRNHETRVNFKGLKGTLILVAQSSNSQIRFKALAVEKFTGDLPAGGKYDFAGMPNSGTAPGTGQTVYRYQGYIFVLQNSEGNIIQFRRSGPFLKTGAEALKLKEGSVFIVRSPLGAFRPRPRASSSSRQLLSSPPSVLPLHVP